MIIWKRIDEHARRMLIAAHDAKDKQGIYVILKKHNAVQDCICLYSNEQLYGFVKEYIREIAAATK